MRVAYYVLIAGTLGGIFVTLHLIGTGHRAIAWVTFMAFIVAHMVKHATRIYYYRRGA